MSNYEKFFEYLTTTYPAVSNDRQNTYGHIWETKVCIWYLKNDPYWKTQFKPESIVSPEDGGYGIESDSTNDLITQDLYGIDLIAEDYDGRFWGIQAKCYTNQIPSTEIKSFITGLMLEWKNDKDTSKTITLEKGLLLITDEISRNIKTELRNLNKEVVRCGPERFEATELDWFKSLQDIKDQEIYLTKKPRPHQENALKNITKGWGNNNKGKVIMACGTGKTLVGLWASEELKSKNTLVLLPSLSLVNQIANEWLQNCNTSISPLFVCSDKTVTRGADQYIHNTSDLGFPVTTDPNEIVNFFKHANFEHRVIFSTYQSSESIEKAQKLGAPTFDIIIADEAHHCAGKVDGDFGRILNESSIKSDKRLFMTATPRYVKKHIKKQSVDNDIELASMDDEETFGPEFYSLSFGEAIADGLLTDYQVVINITTDEEVANMIDKRTLVNLEGIESNAESIGMMCSLIKAIEENDLTHIITYHSRVKQAEILSQDLQKIFTLTDSKYKSEPPFIRHVSGEMLTTQRTRIIKTFRNTINGINILSNARCLTEGVDVRAIDGIAFFEPKRSPIDILQAVGRVIRKNDDNKIGTIFVPVFIPEEELEDKDAVMQNSRFKDVWNILIALKDHDQVLAEEIDGLRFELGKRGNISSRLPSKITINSPTNITTSFSESIKTHLILNTSASWESYLGAVIDWKSKNEGDPIKTVWHNGINIGQWLANQRQIDSNQKLRSDRKKRLEQAGIELNHDDAIWNNNLITVKQWKSENEGDPPNRKLINNINIGKWLKRQRSLKKQGKIRHDRLKRLEDAHIEWNPRSKPNNSN